jgi:hypothetical protein
MEQSLDWPICAPRNDGPPLLLHATWPSLSLMPIWVTIILAIRATCARRSSASGRSSAKADTTSL